MVAIIKQYGALIISCVITVAVIIYLFNSGVGQILLSALDITTDSNENASEASNEAIKNVIERKMPEVTGNTNLMTDTEYSLYGSGDEESYIVKIQDADGNMNQKCSLVITKIYDKSDAIVYDGNETEIDTASCKVENGKILFYKPGIYRMQMQVFDEYGTGQSSMLNINVNDKEE